jgi:hypothetical protein
LIQTGSSQSSNKADRESARAFCRRKNALTKRYPVPNLCNVYYYCYADLYDTDGDLRPLDKIHHLQFTCDTCDASNCNSTINGKNNYLAFDEVQQNCIVPKFGTCLSDGSLELSEQDKKEMEQENNNTSEVQSQNPQKSKYHNHWKRPLMTKEEVFQFCKGKEKTGNYPHPKDQTCSRYVECWFKMDVFKVKACPKVSSFD